MGSFSITQWIIVGLIVFFIYKVFASSSGGGGEKICKACGHVGAGKSTVRGSLGIEIVLWLMLIVPGLIYSVWRHASRYTACPACGSAELIPLNSPIGARLLADNAAAAPTPSNRSADDQVPGSLLAGLGKRLMDRDTYIG